jgi:hypothetical protein
MTKPKRLTIGMRVRVLTIKELEKKLGKKIKADDYFWNRNDGGKHALLQERSSSGGFSILTIGDKWKNERILPKETTGVIDGGGAWVDEDVMEFINADFDVNLDYMDWYQENEDNFCGDCGEWFPNRGVTDPKTGKDYRCPNKKCPGGRWDNGECPDCGTKLSGKHEDYCKKCKVHVEEMGL